MSDERQFSTDDFKSFLERYHLKDNVGNVEIRVREQGGEKELYTKFRSKSGSVKGDVSLSPFDFEECKFGVWQTKKLKQLLSIMDGRFDLELKRKPESMGGGPMALKLTDDFRTVTFHTAELDVVKHDIDSISLKLSKKPPVAVELDVDEEFTNGFTRGMSAVEEDAFAVRSDGSNVVFELGWRRHSGGNTVKLRPDVEDPEQVDEMVFRGDIMSHILRANKSDPGTRRVSPVGMLMVEFTGDRFESNYFFTKND